MRTRRTIRALAAVCCTLLLFAAASSPPAAARSRGWPPRIGAGIPRLTDDRGRTLTLRGWNVEDKTNRGDAALSAITEKHFRDMRAKGFNFARLLVFWDDLEPRRGQYSAAYLRKIERILDWAESIRHPGADRRPPGRLRPGLRASRHPGVGDPDRRAALHPAPGRLVLRVLRTGRAARLHPPLRGRGPAARAGADVAGPRRPLRAPPGRPRLRPDQRADGRAARGRGPAHRGPPHRARPAHADVQPPCGRGPFGRRRQLDLRRADPDRGRGRPHGPRQDRGPEGRLRTALLQRRDGGGRGLRPVGGLDRVVRGGRHRIPEGAADPGGGGRVGPAQQLPSEHGPFLPRGAGLPEPLQLRLGGLCVVLRRRLLRRRRARASSVRTRSRPPRRTRRPSRGGSCADTYDPAAGTYRLVYRASGAARARRRSRCRRARPAGVSPWTARPGRTPGRCRRAGRARCGSPALPGARITVTVSPGTPR